MDVRDGQSLIQAALGICQTHALALAVHYNLANVLENEALSTHDVASKLEIDANQIVSALRILEGLGIVQNDCGKWMAGKLIGAIQQDSPNSLASLFRTMGSPPFSAAWQMFPDAMSQHVLTADLFVGGNVDLYFKKNAASKKLLSLANDALSHLEISHIREACKRLPKRSVAQIGGNNTFLLQAIGECAEAECLTMYASPSLVERYRLEHANLPDFERYHFVANLGSLDRLPRADLFVMQQGLSSLTDDAATELLSAMAMSLTEGGRAVLTEFLIADERNPNANLIDLFYTLWTPRRHRSISELMELFGNSGWEITSLQGLEISTCIEIQLKTQTL